jgi:hypothetical protein
VIVHELINLKVPNHGPVFRSLLKVYLPQGDARVVGRLSCSYGGGGAKRSGNRQAQAFISRLQRGERRLNLVVTGDESHGG